MENRYGTLADITQHGIVFFHEAKYTGLHGLELRVQVDGVTQVVAYDRITPVADGIDAEGPVGGSLLCCRTQMRLAPELNAVTVQHTLVNTTERDFHIAEITTGQFAGDAGVMLGRGHLLGMHLRYCHTDNVRTERYPYCQPEYPYVRTMPTRPVLLGIGEDQPFPGIYFTTEDYRAGLVIAATSQEHTYQSWEFCKAPFMETSLFCSFAIHHELTQQPTFLLGAGQSLSLDGTFYQMLENTHPQDAYVDYIDYLAGRLPLRGQHTPLLDQAFYCSWNYGVFEDQREERLLKTARFMREQFPNISFFLMDAGYVTAKPDSGALSNNFLDRFYPDANLAVDQEKFLYGIRHFSDELRKLGLRPGIWWSPTVRIDSQLYTDHPDWYLRDNAGEPYRIGDYNGFLDFTQPQVRDFVDHALGVLLGEWGMDALKMDFWSQNFEDRDGRIGQAAQTSLACRTILFDLIRKHLPEDGIFMTCVATGMGNPFIGLHADTYRNTIDIGAGFWHEQVLNCIWALPTLSLEGRKSLLLNNDSFGFNLQCPDHENFFRMTWGFITMGMQEIGGRLEELPEHYIRAMRKFTDRCERGFRCLCADEQAFTGSPLPAALYVNYPDASRTRQAGIAQSVALFNWSDEPKIVNVSRAKLGQQGPVRAVNFWTDEEETFADEFLSKRLEGRSALLYDILA